MSEQIVQTLVDAISVGGLYALTALGIGLIFGVMRLINFAHAQLIMAAGYAVLVFSTQSVVLAIAGALAAAMVLALLVERAAFRPLRSADPAMLLIASFAVSFFLEKAMIVVVGSRPKRGRFPARSCTPDRSRRRAAADAPARHDRRLPGASRGNHLVPEIHAAGARDARRGGEFQDGRGAWCPRRPRHRHGVRHQCAARRRCRLPVRRADRPGSAAHGIAALVIIAFVGTVIGGLGSLPGSALGGLVGAVTILLQALLPPDLRLFREAFLFVAVAAVLVVRPQG